MQIMYFIIDKILKLLTYYTPFYHYSLQSYLYTVGILGLRNYFLRQIFNGVNFLIAINSLTR